MAEKSVQSTSAPAAAEVDYPAQPAERPTTETGDQAVLVEAELLVEDVSIDGMCGVY
jgi:mycofactocin precursor